MHIVHTARACLTSEGGKLCLDTEVAEFVDQSPRSERAAIQTVSGVIVTARHIVRHHHTPALAARLTSLDGLVS